jgi:hypothetical protein
VTLKGVAHRFCHQCARMQPLPYFQVGPRRGSPERPSVERTCACLCLRALGGVP